jgi:hypothetical protein
VVCMPFWLVRPRLQPSRNQYSRSSGVGVSQVIHGRSKII